jgi:hypothetical protein
MSLVHDLLDSRSGIGLVVVGMADQGFQVRLGEHGAGRPLDQPAGPCCSYLATIWSLILS